MHHFSCCFFESFRQENFKIVKRTVGGSPGRVRAYVCTFVSLKNQKTPLLTYCFRFEGKKKLVPIELNKFIPLVVVVYANFLDEIGDLFVSCYGIFLQYDIAEQCYLVSAAYEQEIRNI